MTQNNGNGPIIEPAPAEAQAADMKKLSMKGLKMELDDLVNFIEDDVLIKLIEIANDINALKVAQETLSSNQTILQDGMYVLSSDGMKANPPTPPAEEEAERRGLHPAELRQTLTPTVHETPRLVTLEAPEPVQEPEPEPENIQFGTHQHKVLEAIADSCIVMNDILLLCKAMKKVPELTDQTRIALLDLAGRRAGIEIQPGMQVRAGVKQIVA